MNRIIKPGRVGGLAVALVLIIIIYVVFLYKLQIIEGEEYYNRSSETTATERTVTAARGSILDHEPETREAVSGG